MSANTPTSRISLAVPRHLQDYNGYCGPACAMMVLESEVHTVPAQSELFRSIRAHAKDASDRRPIKSPAESMLDLLDKRSGRSWKKVFDPDSLAVADVLLRTIQDFSQPALILISKGMHWVVVFGRTLKEDGSVAGVLLRDPAWAGMPPFFGLSIYPEKTTFTHTAAPCACLNSDNSPGTVHERYIAIDELLSPRGLQGSPDWEGKGALALVPTEVPAAAYRSSGSPILGQAVASASAVAWTNPAEAALPQALEHGLYGRADSPADWKAALEGGQPGEPILVKDPDDSRDNFYLVPIVPINPSAGAKQSCWIMLDATTLRLREASLLEHWKTPVVPNRQDTQNLSDQEVTFPDGTRGKFRAAELKPNQKNLVWKASAATILPYWPVKEWLAPHPLTGELVSIYQTQAGKILTSLGAEDTPPEPPKPATENHVKSDPSPKTGKHLLTACAGIVAGATGVFFWPRPVPPPTTSTVVTKEPIDTNQLKKKIKQLDETIAEDASTIATLRNEIKVKKSLEDRIRKMESDGEKWQQTIRSLEDRLVKASEGPGPDKRTPLLLMEIETLRVQIARLKRELADGRGNDSGPVKGPKTDPNQYTGEYQSGQVQGEQVKGGQVPHLPNKSGDPRSDFSDGKQPAETKPNDSRTFGSEKEASPKPAPGGR